MRFHAVAFFCLLLCLPAGEVRAQAAPSASAAVAPATVAPTTPAAPSTLVQPSLNTLQRTLGALDLEKWKLSRQARDDARRNVESVRQDMTSTLPPLMTAADAAPGSATAELTMLRNVDALYDVALRLSATAALAAPAAQAAALDQALGDLLQARRSLGDRTLEDAAAKEHSVVELQGRLQASTTVAAACPPVTASSAEVKAKVKRVKPRPKPVAPATPQ